jgi:type I restriction-modification system, S subunit
MSFGRPYILNTDGCIHDGWLVISDIFSILDKEFLFYSLLSQASFLQFCKAVGGSVVKNLNSDKVASIFLPLPPLSEQKRIVAKIEELLKFVDILQSSLK